MADQTPPITPPTAGNGWTSHGHPIPGIPQVEPRPERIARCGGPTHCQTCNRDAAHALTAVPPHPLVLDAATPPEDMTPTALAAWYWDTTNSLIAAGLPDAGLAFLRQQYLRDVQTSPEAMTDIRTAYATAHARG